VATASLYVRLLQQQNVGD